MNNEEYNVINVDNSVENVEEVNVEELEDASVKKSNIAKTAAIAVGMGVIGAGAAVAAETLIDEDEEKETTTEEETDITADDLVDGAKVGATNTTITEEKVIHKDDEVKFTTDENVTVVDAEGNVLASQTVGTKDGKAYVATDYDGDGVADEYYYDQNGDGEFSADEGGMLEDSERFAMSDLGQATRSIVYIQGSEDGTGEGEDTGEVVNPGDTNIDDIDNDLNDQAEEGNDIEGDYADNNVDYNNDADISDFA